MLFCIDAGGPTASTAAAAASVLAPVASTARDPRCGPCSGRRDAFAPDTKGTHMSRTIATSNATRRWLCVVVLTSLAAMTVPAFAQSEQDQLVRDAQTTFSNFVRDPDMTWFQRHLGEARAVLIAPKIVRAGWIFGGSGGRAVLFSRNAQSGRWSGPAFYNVGTASVGFQAGIDVSETVTLVMTDRGLNSLMASSVKLGGDASVAAGPIGAGANSDITADLVAFSRSKGVYGGLNLNGTVISVADNWNQAYYGRSVGPPDILMTASAHNPQADQLSDAISRAAGGARTSLR